MRGLEGRGRCSRVTVENSLGCLLPGEFPQDGPLASYANVGTPDQWINYPSVQLFTDHPQEVYLPRVIPVDWITEWERKGDGDYTKMKVSHPAGVFSLSALFEDRYALDDPQSGMKKVTKDPITRISITSGDEGAPGTPLAKDQTLMPHSWWEYLFWGCLKSHVINYISMARSVQGTPEGLPPQEVQGPP